MWGCRWAPVAAFGFVLVTLPAYAQTSISAAADHCADPSGPCAAAVRVAPESAPVNAAPVATSAAKGDGHFPVVLGAFITAASADLAVSMYQIGRGTAREAAFGSMWQDSPVPFAVSKSAMAALFALGVQRIHKDRPKAALIIGISATVMESMLVVRAARMGSVSR